MTYSTKWYVLRWLCGVANIADGLVTSVTLGFVTTTVSLTALDWFLTETDNLAHKDQQ